MSTNKIALTSSMRSNLLSLKNTQKLFDSTQDKLSTGYKVNSAMDNPSSYFTAQSLNSRANDLNTLLDSIGQAVSTLQVADQGITSLQDLVSQAKSIANSARDTANVKANTTSKVYFDKDALKSKLVTDSVQGTDPASDKMVIRFGDSTSMTGTTNVQDDTKLNTISTEGDLGSVKIDGKEYKINTSGGVAGTKSVFKAGTVPEVAEVNASLTPKPGKTLATAPRVLSGLTIVERSDDAINTSYSDTDTEAPNLVKLEALTVGEPATGTPVDVGIYYGYMDGEDSDTLQALKWDGTAWLKEDGSATSMTDPETQVMKAVVAVEGEDFDFTPYSAAVPEHNGVTFQVAAVDDNGNITQVKKGDTTYEVEGLNIAGAAVDGYIDVNTDAGAEVYQVLDNEGTYHAVFSGDIKLTTSTADVGEIDSDVDPVSVDAAGNEISEFGSNSMAVDFSGDVFKITKVDGTGTDAKIQEIEDADGNKYTVDVALENAAVDGFVGGIKGQATVTEDGKTTYTFSSDEAKISIATAASAKADGDATIYIKKGSTVGEMADVMQNMIGTTKVSVAVEDSKLNISTKDTTSVEVTGDFAKTFGMDEGKEIELSADDTAESLRQKIDALDGVSAEFNEKGALVVKSEYGDDLVISGSLAEKLGVSGQVTNGNNERAKYADQFNDVLTQIDQLVQDTSYKGINLLKGDDLTVIFNESSTSKMELKGVTFDSTGLGFTAVGNEWKTTDSIDKSLDQISKATSLLRTQASQFGQQLSTIQVRQDFTENMVNQLQSGADKLVLADNNEEAANLLALQTRQSLGTKSLSLANQSAQSVLQLF